MTFGKRIEMNVDRSLNMAGVRTSRDFALDVQRKIDCTVEEIDGQEIVGGLALQVSLRDDPVKAGVAKLLALTRRRLFLYLLVSDPSIFLAPSGTGGRDLKQLIVNMLPILEKHRAAFLEIGNKVAYRTI